MKQTALCVIIKTADVHGAKAPHGFLRKFLLKHTPSGTKSLRFACVIIKTADVHGAKEPHGFMMKFLLKITLDGEEKPALELYNSCPQTDIQNIR